MAQTEQEAIDDAGAELVRMVRDFLKRKNINATGSLSDSVRYETKIEPNAVSLKIWALDYFDRAVLGRGPTVNPTGGLIQGLLRWIQLGKYGLPKDESVAYAIANKIRKEGSFKFRNKAKFQVDRVEFDEIAQQAASELVKEFGLLQVQKIRTFLRTEL